MARTTSHLSIMVGEIDNNSDESSDADVSTSDSLEDHCCSLDETALADDVVPTYILKPREISKNIDLMKTVAMLMESKLRQIPSKVPEYEKLRELYSDIHRFPEAFQKFTSIIHQIQYLNVTADWEHSSEVNGNTTFTAREQHDNIFTKAFRSSFSRQISSQDYRKKVMISLLSDTQKVFSRYQSIQVVLEERLESCNKAIVKKLQQYYNGNGVAGEGVDTEDDDPQTPLLATKVRTNPQSDYNNLLHKANSMAETLRKTRRSAIDVQDSIDVLKDLIRWDYKQSVSVSPQNNYLYGAVKSNGASNQYDMQGEPSNSQSQESPTDTSSNELPTVNIYQDSCCSSNSYRHRTFKINRKVLIVLAVLIAIIVVLSIITAALSLLKFSY